ncbi:MAG: DNA-3-methyladenine glycosylase [Ilumatobacteraceae bacterium]
MTRRVPLPSPLPSPSPVERALLAGDAPDVAPRLLGKILHVGGRGEPVVAGRIVEVEAYTADDPASHSHRGRTARNAAMFGRAGTLYVYSSYGIHHCANVVTGAEGDGQAVLLRAVAPLEGHSEMRRRRGAVSERRLTDGPGKLCQAFGIVRRHDGLDLCAPEGTSGDGGVRLVDDGTPPPDLPVIGPRVGISRAAAVAWRWRVPGPT